MRPAILAFVVLGCVAAATAGFTSCAGGNCPTMPIEGQMVAVEPASTSLVEHHRQKRAPFLHGAALLGAGALGVGALGVGALGIGALGAGAIGAGVIGAGALAGAGYGRSYGYGGPHYHYHSSPVIYEGGYGGSWGYSGGWGYGGGYGGGWY